MEIDYIGIGNIKTFHGYPDLIVRGEGTAYNQLTDQIMEKAHQVLLAKGCYIYVEGKLRAEKFNMHQLIAMAVVTSSIKHNRHPHLNALVPAKVNNREKSV